MSSVWSALEGGVVGVAVGEAGAAVVEPALEPARQKANQEVQARILDLNQLAELVAQALQTVDDVLDDAQRNGYARDQLLAAIQLALKAPGVPEAERLFLRQAADPAGSISEAQLHHAYAKAGLEYQYWAPLTKAARTTLMTPAQLALGIVRGTVKDPGLLVVTLDTSGSNVAQYTPAALNVLDEAAAAGVDPDRLRALVGSIGLPMSNQQLASATFRGIITRGAFNQGILEGDTRPEWADPIYEQARQILTAHEYTEGLLRGWLPDLATLENLTAQWGMSKSDTELLFNITGRPIPVHRITQGLARGASYNGDTSAIPDVYLQSLRESNIRPPWFPLAYEAERYTWPSYFVLRHLVPDPLSVDQAAQILEWSGWEPTLAKDTAASFAAAAGKPKAETAADLATQYEAGSLTAKQYLDGLQELDYTADAAAAKKAAVDARPLVSARTSIIAKLKTGVVGGALTGEQAAAELAKTTVAPATIPLLVSAWQHEHEIEQLKPPPTPAPAV